MSVKRLSKEEYNSFDPYRGPGTFTGEELEWYSSDSENVIGLLIQDKDTENYVYVVQGPDKSGEFRAIDFRADIPERSEARDKLFSSISEFEDEGREVFPQ